MNILKDVLEIVICKDKKLILIIYTSNMDELAKRYHGMWLLYKKYRIIDIEVPEDDPELEDRIKEIIKKHCYPSHNDHQND